MNWLCSVISTIPGLRNTIYDNTDSNDFHSGDKIEDGKEDQFDLLELYCGKIFKKLNGSGLA